MQRPQQCFLVGTSAAKVVPWPLLLFFRTLMREFQLQRWFTLLPERASQWQLCSRWATTTSYDACTAAGRCPVPCALAGGLFSCGTFFLEFVGDPIWCAPGLDA